MVEVKQWVVLLEEPKEMVEVLVVEVVLHKTIMAAAVAAALVVTLVKVVMEELVIVELEMQEQVAPAVAAAVSLLVEYKTMVVVE